MKTKVFAVFAALAAVTIAAPQHRQTSLNKVAQSPATIFEDYCYDECWQEIKPCPPPWVSHPYCLLSSSHSADLYLVPQ